jgi:hypothetical protein
MFTAARATTRDRNLAQRGRCDEAVELAGRVLALGGGMHSPGVGVNASALVDVPGDRTP